MANFFSTRVHKLKETLGTVQPTADPAPVVEVKEHLKNVKDNITNVQKNAKQLSTDYSKAAQSGDKLGESFVDFGKLYEKCPLGEALTKCGEIQVALNALEHAYASETIEILATPLKRIQDEDIKKAFDLKQKQEDSRVSYDVVLNRHKEFTSKNEGAKANSKAEELEQSLNVAKAAYDTFNQQLINRLNEFDQESSVTLISNIISFLRAQQEHYTKAAALLNDVIPQFLTLESHNHQFIQQMREHALLLKQQQQHHPPPQPQSQPPQLQPQVQQPQPQLQPQYVQNYQSQPLQVFPNYAPQIAPSHAGGGAVPNQQPPLPSRASQQYISAPLYPNVPQPGNNNNNPAINSSSLYPSLPNNYM